MSPKWYFEVAGVGTDYPRGKNKIGVRLQMDAENPEDLRAIV